MSDFPLHEFWLLGISLLIGVVIGSERQYRHKSAGLRTLMLVSAGSCLFTILSIKIGIESPDRIASNIVTGIGFLGAGVIFRAENRISGITTASAIWITASLGMSVGAGYVDIAILGAVAVLIILWLLVYLEKFLEKKSTVRNYKISCLNTLEQYSHYEKMFKSHHLRYIRLNQYKDRNSWTGNWQISGAEKNHERLAMILLNDANIETLDF